jgi:hypothetical protein
MQVAAGGAVLASATQAQAQAKVDEKSPQAVALGYVHDAAKVDVKANPMYKPGQVCTNCIQYTGKPDSAEGPCNLFPGKLVKGPGWCKVWVAKPGTKL